MPSGPEQLVTVASGAGLARWIEGFRARAYAHSITADTFDSAFARSEERRVGKECRL